MLRRNLFAVALLIFACLQLVGYLADALGLRLVGAGSGAAPRPVLFSTGAEVAGWEWAAGLPVPAAARNGGPPAGPEERRRVYAAVQAAAEAQRSSKPGGN